MVAGRVLERIEWVDSGRGSGWDFLSEIKAEALDCVSYGYVVHEDDRSVTISGTVALDDGGRIDQVLCALTIPKQAIKARHAFNVREGGD